MKHIKSYKIFESESMVLSGSNQEIFDTLKELSFYINDESIWEANVEYDTNMFPSFYLEINQKKSEPNLDEDDEHLPKEVLDVVNRSIEYMKSFGFTFDISYGDLEEDDWEDLITLDELKGINIMSNNFVCIRFFKSNQV